MTQMIGILDRHFLFRNQFLISDKISGNQLASVELSDEELEVVQRDRVAELRVKFQVRRKSWPAGHYKCNHCRWKGQETGNCELENHTISRFFITTF